MSRLPSIDPNARTLLVSGVLVLWQHPRVLSLRAIAAAAQLADKLKLLLGFALIVAQVGDVYQIQSVSRDGGASWIDKHPMFNDAKVANKFIKKIENGKDVCSGNTVS